MAFQTKASNEVLNGKDFWRLRQKLESAGDIFEIDVGCVALYVGPDSDAGDLKVTYYDPNVPNELQTAVISPGAPFIGRLDALLATNVAATGQKARILVSPADVIGQNYVRPVITQPAVTVRVPAFIDIIAAFRELTGVPRQRSDRQFRTPTLSVGAGGNGFVNSTDIQFPIYNRRCWSVAVSRPVTDTILDVSINAVRLAPGANNPPVVLGSITIPSGSVDQAQSLSFRACETGLNSLDAQRTAGIFDLLLINLQTTGPNSSTIPTTVTITTSDSEG